MRRTALFLAFAVVLPAAARAQLVADTLFAWRGYTAVSTCQLRIYAAPPGAERAYVVVVRELAENAGRSTTSDARHLAEVVARRFGLDPAAAWWIFQWDAGSFEGAADSDKELFLRATFRRSRSGALGAPQWRLLSRAEVVDLTDRHFR